MKNRLLKRVLHTGILSIFSLFLVQCSGQKAEHQEATEHESGHEEEIVKLTDKELEEFGIELVTAGPGKLIQYVNLTGEVVIDPDRLAHISPRFQGIVKEVKKRIGDTVKQGDILAIIESNESLSTFELLSQIDGTIIDMHLTRGEVISDSDHSITIADLSTVWGNLNVYQKDLSTIKIGQSVKISAGPHSKEADGKITYLSPYVNESTRTATARVIIKNPSGFWRPGLFINAKVIIGAERVDIYVPKTALETFENRTVVFVKQGDGFVPQPIDIGKSNTHGVEVTHGIEPGQVYAAKNGFSLKAELQKESFGKGHEH